ncbi:TPA: ATPase [Streptococcus pyogenes]|nr:Chromosome segregation ATPase [Streptococcus pyogenes]VGQ58532.1 Chromosome segregation ATPase [Streptococcus pyogenes]VGT45847.1 ATPase [Streptococcus pyogenes]VGT70237.1 ATPase [Streptococcus pyogenes]VGU65256.1 chromosome segregation ATPase [Streptococcus pyogenes]
MLIEMWSPVFKKHGEIREPIQFHPGLNVIMGMDLADNSIGKSSSLLAIDFIFGGNSYLKSIAVKKLGDHPIYFCFQFEKKFYFSRDTANPDIILVCDKSYSPIGETMDLGIFLNKLKKRYHLDSPELSFRLAMSGFFRIAGKSNQNTDFPLQVYSSQKSSESITTLIQLFNLYDNIARYKESLKDKSDQLTTFRNARKYAFISNLVGDKKQFEANVSEIKRLEHDLAHLQDTHQDKIDSDDIEKNQQKIQLRNTKLELDNSLRDKQRRLKLLAISIEFGLYPTESDLTELQQYFPDTNLKKLYEVEAYHKKLETILDSEFSTERESLIAEIDELESQLTTLNQELQELGNIPNLSSEYLENYSKLAATINALKEQNEAYLKESGLSKEKS